MSKICVSCKKILNFDCKYYVVKSSKKIEDVEELADIYGIQIDKFDSQGQGESSIVKDIGSDIERVIDLIQRLKNGGVTPITLQDIVIDNI